MKILNWLFGTKQPKKGEKKITQQNFIHGPSCKSDSRIYEESAKNTMSSFDYQNQVLGTFGIDSYDSSTDSQGTSFGGGFGGGDYSGGGADGSWSDSSSSSGYDSGSSSYDSGSSYDSSSSSFD